MTLKVIFVELVETKISWEGSHYFLLTFFCEYHCTFEKCCFIAILLSAPRNCNPWDDSQSGGLELKDLAELSELSECGFDVFAYIKTLDFKLRKWAIDNNIRLSAMSHLLKILKANGHPSLPMDARTILKTPKKVNVFKMGSGECWYGGLKSKLIESCKKYNCSDIVELNIHIDGTPIYKSSKSEFWPIQCSIKGVDVKSFFVQLFQGSSKPDTAEIFLRPLLNEMHELLASGLTVAQNEHTKTFQIRIDKFILDAPARAFLKCIIGHSGYYSCERCEEKGEYLCKVRAKVSNKRNAGHVCLIGTHYGLVSLNKIGTKSSYCAL